jgi:uncharacterized protein with HEPN domain
MTKHRDIVPLGAMLDTGLRVLTTTAHKSRAQFDADEHLQFALTHLLQSISRAAARVSEEARNAHPEIDWLDVVGIQDRVARDYRHIDLDAVWVSATADVPRLLTALEAFMPSDPP